jgi:hypothetical protein
MERYRRIGSHLGKYPAAAAIVVAESIHDAGGRAAGLRVSSGPHRRAKGEPENGRVSLER